MFNRFKLNYKPKIYTLHRKRSDGNGALKKGPLQPIYLTYAISLLVVIFMDHEEGNNKETATRLLFVHFAEQKSGMNLAARLIKLLLYYVV